MNNITKILSISLLVAGANILSAADNEDATNRSASMVSSGTFCEARDIKIHIDAFKKEEVEGLIRYIDSLAQGGPQFLADSVPVGGPGQPVDRSCAAFKTAISNAVFAQEVYSPARDGAKVDLKHLQESVKATSYIATDTFVGVNLKRCGDEMLHPSVSSADRSSAGFMNGVIAVIGINNQ